MAWWMYVLAGLGYVLVGDTIARLKLKVLKNEITNPVIRYFCFPLSMAFSSSAIVDGKIQAHPSRDGSEKDPEHGALAWVFNQLLIPHSHTEHNPTRLMVNEDSARKYIMLSWLHWPLHVVWLALASLFATPIAIDKILQGLHWLIGKGFSGVYDLLGRLWTKKPAKVRVDEKVVEEAESHEAKVRREMDEARDKLAELKGELEEIEKKKGPYGRGNAEQQLKN